MYTLSSSLLVGKGLHRECYVHPDHPSRCIKVVVAGSAAESRREQKYYRLLEKRNISWDMLPRFYGHVDTDKGAGAVFDLIRDGDGDVSKPLTHYINDPTITKRHADGLKQALTRLNAYLLRNAIVTMTLKAKNMVYCRTSDDSSRLVVVDNIGNSDFIPVCNWLDRAARIKIRRKWRQFEARLRTKYAFNPVLQHLIEN